MTAKLLRPARPGLVVIDPETRQQLAPDGELKPRSSFWLRRLRDGDVVEAPAPAAPILVTSSPAPGAPTATTTTTEPAVPAPGAA